MKLLNAASINTPEHYNRLFGRRNFGIAYNYPVRAEALLKKFTGGKFLDVGCGLAPHSEMASKVPNSQVYAIDFSDKLIESLKARFPQINYLVGDISKLPFEDAFFDYIIMGEVLEHTDDPSVSLAEIVRTLKVGGTLALSVPMNDGGKRSPNEHKWSFIQDDIKLLLEKFGETEVIPIRQGHLTYIVGYMKKC